jgi:energy-coupling factor transporter ATP-binding protein EcfA2
MPGHHSPLKFVRSRGSRPLPVPELGGTLEALTGFVNVHTDDVPLVFGFLVAAMRPAGPHPILALISQQGSGKSTLARILKALVDPNAAPIRAAPREERDLHVAARNSWMLAFDNLSSLPPWLADGMASLSTGAGYAARELRSDVDEVVFECKRPQILNSISDIASRPDLASRAVNIEMLPINGAKRRAESEFWADFERKRPRILGGLLSAVAGALRSLDSVEIVDKPRMADFACWSVAAEPWLPIKRGDFLRSYRANLKAMTDTSIENDRFIREVLRLVREIKKWRGSAADLLDAIKARLADKDSAKAKGFPKTGQWTSVKLRRFAVALADVGVTVDFGRETEKRFIELKLRQ